MDDQKQQEGRWRELAELLGLSDDAPPAAKKEPPAPPAPPPESPAIKAYEEPRSIAEHAAKIEEETPRPPIHDEQDAPTIPMLREEPVTDWESEFEDEDNTPLEEPEEAGAEETEAAEEEHAGEPAAAAEEEKPRRGRRRRRRGRRRGGADKPGGEGQPSRTAAEESTAPPSRPARDAEQESRDRRGRRGGKRRDDEEPRPPSPPRHERQEPAEPVEADDFHDEKPSAAHGNEVHDADADFPDWNVPSWQDLISSLYRPDR
jgi:hypothetical protein